MGRGAGLVYRGRRQLRRQLRQPDPLPTAMEQPPALHAMVCLVTPSDPFGEAPTGVPWPMHISWHRLTDGRMPQYTGDGTDGGLPTPPAGDHGRAAGSSPPTGAPTCGTRRWTTGGAGPLPAPAAVRPARAARVRLVRRGRSAPRPTSRPCRAGRAGQRLLMGPSGHRVNSSARGEVDFGPQALIDLDGAILSFLDEHVRGAAPRPAPAAVRIFVMGAGDGVTNSPGRRTRRPRPCSTSPAAGGPTAGSATGGWSPSPCRAAAARPGRRPGPAGAVHHRLQLRADRRPGATAAWRPAATCWLQQ